MHRLAEGGARGVVREGKAVCACTFSRRGPEYAQNRLPSLSSGQNFSIGIGIVTHHFGEDLTCRDCLLGRRVGGWLFATFFRIGDSR